MQDRGERFLFSSRELGGALGDLGTLLPLMLGSIAIAGLAPLPVLLGFAAFYIATAFWYRLPVPVQPMKAVAAVILTTGATAPELAAAGVLLGLALLVLGATGWIGWLARVTPQPVLAGLQLGLGVTLALMSLDLMATAPPVAIAALAILSLLLLAPRFPVALAALAGATLLGWLLDVPRIDLALSDGPILPAVALPSLGEAERALAVLALPQLSLTITNAVLLTALVAGDRFGEKAGHVTPTRLSISSGLANLVLTPFGALPMCHGAGGLAAHYRFGARSGTAPLLLGLALAAAALAPSGLAAIAMIPAAGLGALLLVAAWELAVNRRLYASPPAHWPVIAAAAGVTIWADPFWGLLAGAGAHLFQLSIERLVRFAR